MPNPAPTDYLSQLSTHWQEIDAAHGAGDAARAAQCAILQRYFGAVYHYLLAATRDPHSADDLSQEFALRFVRGDFHRLHPSRGRFRDFVKTVLYHLIVDHHRSRGTVPGPLPDDSAIAPPGGSTPDVTDEEFMRLWREELLERTWAEMRQRQDPDGAPFYAVLRWRADHPKRPAAHAADELGQTLGRSLTEAGFRQVLHRAREQFADLFVAEVRFSLGDATTDEVEGELAELGLLSQCQHAVDRLGNWGPASGAIGR